MAGIRFRWFPHAAPVTMWAGMSRNVTKFERSYRAEGIAAGCLPVNFWPLDPARELPGRRCPMFVQPPPERPLVRRIAAAAFSLGSTIAVGACLMVLAQQLTTP